MSVIYAESGPPPARALPKRDVARAMRRGLVKRCPACGEGTMFRGFSAVADHCDRCGEALHHHRADDFPPYATIFVIGHVVVPSMYLVEKIWRPELWVHAALWLPLTVLLSVGLLRPLKGAIIGLQWALYMHGFDPNAGAEDAAVEIVPSTAKPEGRP